MKQIVTTAIVLSRTEYGEADRILTLLTPDYGKLKLVAKGVRKAKSKLAGGIELFSTSNITFIRGKGDLGTLASARLLKHYGNIVTSIERVQLGYELIKIVNKATEDEPESEYFTLLEQSFAALDDVTINEHLIRFWFYAQMLRLGGNTPNLQTDITGQKLKIDQTYTFSFEDMAFAESPHGSFTADTIKFFRLAFSGNQPTILQRIKDGELLLQECTPLIRTMLNSNIHV